MRICVVLYCCVIIVRSSDIPQTFPNILKSENADNKYQLVYLRRSILPEHKDDTRIQRELQYDFTAFGREVSLRLTPNKRLVSPNFRLFSRLAMWSHEVPGSIPTCHYLHTGPDMVAAFSLCNAQGIHGFVIFTNDTLEIQPLTPSLRDLLSPEPGLEPHIVQWAPFPKDTIFQDAVFPKEKWKSRKSPPVFDNRYKRNSQKLTLEMAMFFDEAAYKIFSPFFRGNDYHLRDMLLAYVNGVQALYHHPSVGQSIDLTLVRLEIMKAQPPDLPHYGGERGKLLDSFCDYNARHNPKGDTNPDHWDIGLYVSGLDFYAYENGRRSMSTMGLATVGGVCMDKYACIIAELGTTNIFGKPYPSAGFTSVYVLAHEIGHNLGMHHDSSNNNCPKEGFIMSPSRGTVGETQWSTCSADVMRKLSWATCLTDVPVAVPSDMDHSRYLDEPGQQWGAKKQCEILLRDKDAELQYPEKTQDICENLKCRTPHRSGFYFAGPALEGTSCGIGKWCQGGECVPMKKKKPVKVVVGGWSEWKKATCSSGCILKSQGFQTRRRFCDNPKPVNTDEGCDGPSFDVVLCKDEKICKKNKRRTAAEYASSSCAQFSKLLSELDPVSSGLQAPHEEARLWMGCAIFCRRRDTGSYYTPRIELNDLGVNPYFPDGTWCHNDGVNNYFCQQHHCLPENFQFGKNLLLKNSEDVPLPQNAPPELRPVSGELLKYLSVGEDGRPLLTTLTPGSTKLPDEEEWTDHDYLEIPHGKIILDQPYY